MSADYAEQAKGKREKAKGEAGGDGSSCGGGRLARRGAYRAACSGEATGGIDAASPFSFSLLPFAFRYDSPMPISVRRALLVALLVATGCASHRGAHRGPAPSAPAHFRILQINDVYKIEGLEGGASGGLARVRALREHLETDNTPVLLLHAGDALFPSVMSKHFEARAMVDVMNRLDGDEAAFDPRLIVTFGNHELDKSDARVLLARLNESRFQWVATNTVSCDENRKCVPFSKVAPTVKDTLLLDIGNTRVGILGVVYPFTKSYAKSTDVIGAAAAAVASLRKRGARVVIAITHEDMPDDVDLVHRVPGIDLVIGGHDHLYAQQQVGDTWITKADADAKSVIVYDVVVPARGAIKTAPLRVTMDATMPKDRAVDMSVQSWLTQLSQKLGDAGPIGRTKFLLEGIEPAVRGRETALGNLLADVARAQMGTDVAVLNGGGIRINDNIPPGPITRYDMEGIFYYPNRIVAFPATGAQLLEMLRNSVSRIDAGDGRFLQVSGLRYRYRRSGDRYVVNPDDVTIGGAPLELTKRYTVATVDFLYNNGIEDGYTLFTEGNRPAKINVEREADHRTLVEAYLRKVGTTEVNVEGRITRVE
jgi:2',3'-cyclic-nucleotide 2'-phosphodiesterase (5'-nucleotidase family)